MAIDIVGASIGSWFGMNKNSNIIGRTYACANQQTGERIQE